ncbi:MAG: helicase-exonuclease AddAB subunit AddA [Lactobacillaceae bacterium]|jgi:ATP-dependent helicase/nuclease subunit A|nr:helicase-exonuclease AddAB subunit AddA [Lactobacillaceae bacterium]
MVQATLDQQKIIDYPIGYEDASKKNKVSRGSLIVSASAGSGKTATLVNRVIRAISEQHVDIEELLIITFTRQAAESMKIKIEQGLREEVDRLRKEKPVNSTLISLIERQLVYLPSARITTIDSFAGSIIDDYYDYLEVDLEPGYQILGDTVQQKMLANQVTDELFGNYYKSSENEWFLNVVRNFGTLEQPNGLKQLIVDKLYPTAMSKVDFEKWMDNDLYNYYNLELNKIFESDLVLAEQNKLKSALTKYEMLESDLNSEDEVFRKILETPQIKEYLENILNALENKDWDLLVKVLSDKIGKLSSVSKKEYKPFKEEVKILKKEVDAISSNLKEIFFLNEADTKIIRDKSKEILNSIVRILKDFIQEFNDRKVQDSVIDFSDLERYALNLVENKEVQSLIREQYVEVMVDEFQDINPLQEKIIEDVAGDHLFAIGDIKQSIYRFRQAEPELFNNRFKNYLLPDSNNKALQLSDNFRSTRDILDFSNLIFDYIMDEKIGGVDYKNDGHDLRFGNKNKAKIDSQVQFLLSFSDKNDEQSEENDDELSNSETPTQVIQVVDKIEEIVANGQYSYNDIAILGRSRNGFDNLIAEFNLRNIPVNYSNQDGYYKSIEVSIILNYLNIVDNPHQDIPLVAVLRSPMYGLNEIELSEIRLNADFNDDFYDAVLKSRKNNPKIELFLNDLQYFILSAQENKIDNLILEIYSRTNWLEFVTGMKNGSQREANLNSLYELAKQFSRSNFIGLFQFIRYIELQLNQNNDIAEVIPPNANKGVKLMTIHSSKGLEFPVVFLFNSNKKFNTRDKDQIFIFDNKTGASVQVVDRDKNIKISSIARPFIVQDLNQGSLSEELRLLYVALTRAENQLYVSGSYTIKKDQTPMETIQEKWGAVDNTWDQTISLNKRMDTNNYLDFMGMVLYHTRIGQTALQANKLSDAMPEKTVPGPDINFSIEVFQKNNSEQNEQLIQNNYLNTKNILQISSKEIENIKEQLNQKYLFEDATNVNATASVSEAKNAFESNLEDEKISYSFMDNNEIAIPQFMQDNPEINDAAIAGTDTHAVLQKIDWSREINEQYLKDLSKEYRDVNLNNIEWFLNTSLASEIKENQKTLQRERAFSLLISATELGNSGNFYEDDQVLIHGQYDGFFIDENKKEITLFDYKTNWFPKNKNSNEFSQRINKLVQNYKGQLDLYSRSLEEIYPEYVVKHKYIIFLSAHEVVDLVNL